jgi:simple sugar transport system permease protein
MVEGLMTIGAIVAYIIVIATGSYFASLLAAALIGIFLGAFLGLLTISLKMDQTLTGMLMWIFGIGAGALLYRIVFGVRAFPIMITKMESIEIPILSNIPVIGPSFFNQNVILYIAYFLIAPATYFLLFKTTYGLKIRAVGENPKAADTLGINVNLVRYLTFIFAGAMECLAGAYLLIVETAVFTPCIAGGRGWITLQLVMFGRWNPPLIFMGSLLFACIEALAYKFQLLYKFSPYQFLLMLPYITTIIALVAISRGAVWPRML